MAISSLPGKGGFSIKTFILRSQVRALYRAFLRATHALPPSDPTRIELQAQIRTQFDANSHVADEGTIKYLVSEGYKQLKQMQQMIKSATGS
eukprot:GILK01016100.1.p1 GENE.GILK01016100.1~~GILK01016100.1.p1  ORF type:complete len:102 (+),score=11.77 GILK01016100.1:32-307(+)